MQKELPHRTQADRLLPMQGEQDGGAGRGQLPQQGSQPLAAGVVQGGQGFIEEKHIRVLGQGPGDQGALPLTAGELADGAVGEGLQAHLSQGGQTALAIAVGAQGHQAQEIDGVVPGQGCGLRQEGHSAPLPPQGSTLQAHPAPMGRKRPLEETEQGGFTRAVVPQENRA